MMNYFQPALQAPKVFPVQPAPLALGGAQGTAGAPGATGPVGPHGIQGGGYSSMQRFDTSPK